MNNQQAVVDQIVQNLAFEVEAVPKNKSIQATSISQSTPLNVKIKVRKKDEVHKQHDVSSIVDDTPRAVQKIRLVNSDRTIMTFDVFMEAEFEKKPSRNLRKHIFGMLRPGICLGAVDDDEYPYMPSSSYSANITEPSVANKSDGTLKQTFTLSKNVYQDYNVSTQPGGQKWLFGKCKPGGCLDPPFSEDKYSYKPSTRSGPERGREELHEKEDVRSEIYNKKIPITLHEEELQSNGRHSSIFDSGLFKKKRKISDKSTNTKLSDKTDSIVDIYQWESATNSLSTHSNSIITYPPKVRSDPRISDDKTVRSRGPSEEKSRKSFNDHSEPYFIRPKGVNRIKEKETLNPSDYPNHRSSDATDLRNSLNESFKMPVLLPVPIPVPISIMSNKRNPEVIATNDNILKTQGDSANITELDAIPDQKPQDQESQDQESQDAINLKETDVPTQLLRVTSATKDTGDKPVESSKIATLIPSNVEQPITPNEKDDQNLHEIKLQTLIEIHSENNIDDTAPPSKKTKTEPLKMPVPVPFIFSETNRAAALDSKIINDNLQRSKLKLTQSKQSFKKKTTPPTIKDTPFQDSKDMQQNIDSGNRSGKSESTATATPKSQYSYIEADAIPENYFRTRGGFSDQESDTENPVSILPKMEEHTKRNSKGEKITEGFEKPAKQNYIKDKATTSAAATTAAIAIAAAAMAAAAVAATTALKKESSDIYEMPDTQKITGSPKKYDKKDSQRISLSKLPIVIRSISILSGSKTSEAAVKDKIKRSDSPDKHLDSVGYIDSDLGVHKDEKRTSLSSEPTSGGSVKDKTKRSDSPDNHLDNVGHRDTDLGVHKDEKRTSLSSGPTSAASVKDKTKRSDSPDKHLGHIGHRDSDLSVHKVEKQTSLSSGLTSAASVKDKTKRNDSPDKHLDNVGHRDSGVGVHKDEKRTSLSSRLTSAASVKDKTRRRDSPDKHLGHIGHRDSDLSVHKVEKQTSLSSGLTSAASVKDKTKRNDSPDKHLDNVGHRDSGVGVHKDEKRTSLSSRLTSAASVKDKTRRRDSPDKHLDNVGHRDTDLGVLLDDKQRSLSSGRKYETDTRDTKKSELPSDKEYVSETEKPNNDDKIDSYTESQARFTDKEIMNFIAAPIIIDNTEPTPNFQLLKEVYSETNLFFEPMNTGHELDPSGVPFTTQVVSRFRKLDEDDGTHSTVSHELIGTKSVIYDTDEYFPTTSANKNAERIISSDKRVDTIQSTSTLKSATKKDTMSVELGFHSYLNDKNERILRTFDATNAPKRLPNDSVTVLNSQIRIFSNELRIPVDSEHDMSIQIKKANANHRVSISESGFVNIIDNGIVKQQRSRVQCSDAEMRSSEVKTEVRKDNMLESDATDDRFIDYYEQELLPLQSIIKNLRDEIDVLAAQQLIFKDKLFCANKSKLPRLVHSNKKCFGCVRK